MMDIRTKTGIIIEKDGEYLVAVDIFGTSLVWSDSPWDAWITRKRDHALMVAEKVGGRRVLFNPVVGQIKLLEV